MSTITYSADGTAIAFQIDGPDDARTVVWVHGASVYRAFHNVPTEFAARSGLRVVSYDRRGRGDSGDTAPYAVNREIDDLVAVIDAAGGAVAALIGESSGGILALKAAIAGAAASGVIAYEPPFLVDNSRPTLAADYVERLDRFTAAGDAESAHRLFLTEAVGLPPEFADGITESPLWPLLEPIAPTLAYDGRLAGEYLSGDPASLVEFEQVPVPVLVGVGGDTWAFLRAAADALVEVVPSSWLEVIPGGTHQTDPELVATPFAAFVKGLS